MPGHALKSPDIPEKFPNGGHCACEVFTRKRTDDRVINEPLITLFKKVCGLYSISVYVLLDYYCFTDKFCFWLYLCIEFIQQNYSD